MKKKLIALLTAIAVLPATLLAGTSPAAAYNRHAPWQYDPDDVSTWLYPDTTNPDLNRMEIFVCDAGTEIEMPETFDEATSGLNEWLQTHNCQKENDSVTFRFNYVSSHKTILGIASRKYLFHDEVGKDDRNDFISNTETFNMAFKNREVRPSRSTNCPENVFLTGYQHSYASRMQASTYPYMSQGIWEVSMRVVPLNDVPSHASKCLNSTNDTYIFKFWSNNEPILYQSFEPAPTQIPRENLGLAYLYYRLYKPSSAVPAKPKKPVVTHTTNSKVLKRKSRKAKTVQVRFHATCKTTLRTSCTPNLGSYKKVKVRNLSTKKTYTLARHFSFIYPRDLGQMKVKLRKGKNKLRITAPRHKTKTVILTRR